IVLAPFNYIKSLPSKGVRDILIDSLNVWFQLPENSLQIIKKVVDLLHTSSLLFDDMEDESPLRRGRPTAHMVFGIGQTINSSTYILISSISEVQKLSNKDCVSIVTEGVSDMLLGQSIDLHTTYLAECPREDEYLNMVDKKTGGLFRIAHKLMEAESQVISVPDVDPLMILLGRYFQIRDDYINLVSTQYADQKGFCEDLDEGKFSFPLIHCLTTSSSLVPSNCSNISPKLELQNIFMARNRSPGHGISPEMKLHVLEILESTGSLEFTKLALETLNRDLQGELGRLERVTGQENPGFRMLVQNLKKL
ncbi:putative geranylgeranyl pyrophosphate synthase, partial [Geopyxis carbonaria]